MVISRVSDNACFHMTVSQGRKVGVRVRGRVRCFVETGECGLGPANSSWLLLLGPRDRAQETDALRVIIRSGPGRGGKLYPGSASESESESRSKIYASAVCNYRPTRVLGSGSGEIGVTFR